MSLPDEHAAGSDDEQLAALGYTGEFERGMGLWSNMALGFTYLSPLVGVYSLFAYSLSIGGPPAIWWIVIVGAGQLLVALVFGEVVSQYPLAGGIYPWTRRLWNRRYAWIVSWIYIWAVIVTITAVAEFGGGFVAALFGIEATPGVGLVTAVGLLVIALSFNVVGTRDARPGRQDRAGRRADRRHRARACTCCCSSASSRSPSSSTRWAPAGTTPTSSPSSPRRCPACSCSTASRRAATSPRRSPTRPGGSRRR